MRIAVAGATGRVGRHVVNVLKARGHDVVAISRSNGVDVISCEGLANALVGVERVIDVTDGPSPEQESATKFFMTAARNLQTAGEQAGVKWVILVSIIGIDKFTAGYMAAKVVHEKTMLEGPIQIRILRAAQFHEFVAQIIDWGKQGEVSYVPKMLTQLVAARTVAEALAELVLDPGSMAPMSEIAGPKPEDLVAAASLLVSNRGDSLRIEGVSNVADPDRTAYESGALLPSPNATLAGPTFEEWLKK